MCRWFAILICCGCWLVSFGTDNPTAADQPNLQNKTQIDFAKDVYPILQRACFECHGSKKQEGSLRLDQRTEAMKSILPADIENSELLRRISLPRGAEGAMPAVGEPLPKDDITTLRAWIAQGAIWPQDFEAASHWSYTAPRRPELPVASKTTTGDLQWGSSPMDAFVFKRLLDEGLSPSPAATPEKLVRRLFLDLIGLPPTPTEVQAFVADPTEQRYEELVDDLLHRPQFGERWARPWLDLARYADSHGFQRDDFRDLWAYRDWVIQALNNDMPFNQFTIEQIAGDLLPNATESQRVATGFHRCSPTNCEAGSLPEETRIEQVIDRVNTTATVWLGTTLECCQCHDHKYDPFTMKEYYQLLAFFNNTELEADLTNPNSPSSIQFKGPTMPLAHPQRDAARSKLLVQLAAIDEQLANRRRMLDSNFLEWSREFASEQSNAAQSHALEVIDFQSTGTTDSFKKLEDGSILMVGDDPPDTDEYRVRVRAELKEVRAFRLDVLRHDSLPGNGPGRGDAKRRNFILNDFKAEVSVGGVTTPLTFKSATASYSQPKWDVLGTIDQSAKTGWAISPEFDRSHWATFALDVPLNIDQESQLNFTLTQHFGQARTIGCFRLTALTGNVGAESVANELISIASKPMAEWTKQEHEKLLEYLQFRSQGDPVLFLSNPQGHTREARRRLLDSLAQLNQEQMDASGDPEVETRIGQYEMAFRMQASVPSLMDLSSETVETMKLYGAQPGKASFANNCLLARRLVERGVRLIELYDSDWDHHGGLETRLPEKCKETDQPIAALIKDLRQRDLLKDTLIVWGSEFGRTPLRQGATGEAKGSLGRDHHKDAFTMWMAGGGVRGGVSYGASDDFGMDVLENGAHVHDINATILHLLGLDHEKLTFRYQGREFRLTDVHGKVINAILS